MATKKPSVQYETNPFNVGIRGFSLLFSLSKSVAIFLVVVSVIAAFTGIVNPEGDKDADMGYMSSLSSEDWVRMSLIIIAATVLILFISALFSGIASYTVAHNANGKKVTLGEAFRGTLDHIWPFIWLQVIIFVKLLLWALLLIIPAIIMSVRYSLANVAFFDDKVHARGNAAIKESLRLTKGAWLTTYASSALLNIITLGFLDLAVRAGAEIVLYKQYRELEAAKKPHPKAHFLSWLTLIVPFALVAVGIMLFIAVVILAGVIKS